MAEDELETFEILKSKLCKDVLKTVYPDDNEFDTSTLIQSAKRLGQAEDDQPRMVMLKLKSFESKMKLFGVRDELREKGIRIANDLTSLEQEQLKDLSRRGKRGFFKNGVLNILESEHNASAKTRVFKRGSRKSAVIMDTSENIDTSNKHSDNKADEVSSRTD